jgi:hypothetical protein
MTNIKEIINIIKVDEEKNYKNEINEKVNIDRVSERAACITITGINRRCYFVWNYSKEKLENIKTKNYDFSSISELLEMKIEEA